MYLCYRTLPLKSNTTCYQVIITLCLRIKAIRLIEQTLYASLDKQSKIKLSN